MIALDKYRETAADPAASVLDLRRALASAADELEDMAPIVEYRFVDPERMFVGVIVAILSGFALGIAFAVLLYHTVLAPAYDCRSYSTGGYTCSRR